MHSIYRSLKRQRRVLSTCLVAPSSEHAELRRVVRRWTLENVEAQAAAHDRSETMNIELFRRLGTELSVLGPTVAEEYGGSGMDATAACIIGEELSWSDPGLALSWMAHAILLVHNFDMNASPKQREAILPALLSGEKIGGMAMSEAGAGTDVLGMQTTGSVNDDGYLLNGAKFWITNGRLPDDDGGSYTVGNAFLVYARTGPNKKDISLFYLDDSADGFSLGQSIMNKCGMRSSPTAELVFQDCQLPSSALLGRLHQGLIPMMANLQIERLVLAAMACGIGRRAFDTMLSYAKERQAFASRLYTFGQIQAMLADSYAELEAARSFLYATANTLDGNQRLETDAVKLIAARTATTIADRAIQIGGGAGYVDSIAERLWRDSKLLQIGGGTNESHQKNMTADLVRFYDADRY